MLRARPARPVRRALAAAALLCASSSACTVYRPETGARPARPDAGARLTLADSQHVPLVVGPDTLPQHVRGVFEGHVLEVRGDTIVLALGFATRQWLGATSGAVALIDRRWATVETRAPSPGRTAALATVLGAAAATLGYGAWVMMVAASSK